MISAARTRTVLFWLWLTRVCIRVGKVFGATEMLFLNAAEHCEEKAGTILNEENAKLDKLEENL